MFKRFLPYILLFISTIGFSQRGKDLAGNIIAANTVVNLYIPVTANTSTNSPSISVTSTAGLAVGDLVFIIQMQGASVNAGRDTLFPDVMSSVPTNSTYGAVTAYNNCGNYEFGQINSLPNNTTINLDCNLKNNYHFLNKVQVIRVPRYTTLLVSGAGNIICPAWNGTIGGVIVVEVMNNATLTAVPSINASATGFRGGTAETVAMSLVTFGNKYGHISRNEGGYKGESINGDTTRYQVYSAQHCRGAMANGGGGGTTHNSGGGGGANAGNIALYTGLGNPQAGYNAYWNMEFFGFGATTSSGGGRGGYSWSNSGSNPSVTAVGAGAWGGDSRRNMGGAGGRPLDYTLGKLFLGGGGGSGHGNDARAGGGGRGGGLVYMLCYGNISGAGTILADGQNGFSTLTNCGTNDGGGGAGGGGAIVLNIVGGTTLTAATALSVKGGNGGNCSFNCGISNTNSYGPGAGGGGGYIGVTGTLPLNSVAGGTNGIHTGNNNTIGLLFPPNGATAGGSGSTAAVPASPTITASNVTICVNNSATVSATSGTSAINWYTVSAGGTAIGSGTTFVNPTSYTATGIFTLYAQPCPGSYREPVLVSVTNGPTVTVNSATICYGASAVLTASGATSYSWNVGPITASISASPTLSTVYTVTGTSFGCSSLITGTITVTPIGTISVNSPTICSGTSTILTAGAAASYTWGIGPNTQTISVSPTLTTVYSVSATTAGSCLLSNTCTVTVNTTPTVSAGNATICSGKSATLTASGATNFTWNPGALTGTSAIVSPTITTTYTINGTTGNCTDTKTLSVTVNTLPAISVNNASICSGTNAILTASGGVTYTWTAGPLTPSISVSPTTTTIYTVTGGNGTCTNIITSIVNVTTTPTVIVNSPTVCSGSTVLITASGAANYTWSVGPFTPTISVSPTVTTIYTVTGTNGNNCNDVKTSTVAVTPQPSVTLNANNFNICGGQSATIIATAPVGTFSWSNGATTSVITTSVGGVYNVTVTNAPCGSVVQSATVTSGAAPAFTINPSSTVICNSQSVTLITAGSTGTFAWSNGAGNTPSISTNVPGIYTATLNNACGTATYAINIIDGGTGTVGVSATSNTICSGGSVTLTATGTGTFAWSNGAGNVTSITVTNTGVYTVSVTNVCPGATTATFNVVNGAAPSLSITPSSSLFCFGQTATLTASGSAGTYSWVGGTIGSVFTTTAPGVYTAVVTNSCGTTNQTFILNFKFPPSVSVAASKTVICSNETVTLTAGGGLVGPDSYSWSSSTNTTNIETVTGPGNYIAYNTNACGTATASVNIIQSTLTPNFTFTPDGGIAPVQITFNNTSINNINNQWQFGNGSTSTNTNDVSNYLAAGIYTVYLIIENSDGCVASTSRTLEIKATELGIIPEVLTPNGDGKNDLFEIKGLENYPDNELQIFNRWGNLVYKTAGYKNTWDGTPNAGDASGKLPTGTYYYLLKLNDSNGRTFNGFVQLMY